MATALDFHEETSFLADLPKETWWENTPLLQWKGFWLMPDLVAAVMAIETRFNPLPSDILLASFPKAGTTWLKALTISILTHNSKPKIERPIDPLLTHNPHELVPFLEMETFGRNPCQDISKIPSPRVFNTHLPFSILPEHVKNSGCRIVYISRNPADTFVSGWLFYSKNFGNAMSMQMAFDEFCRGFVPAGPFFDHVIEYWKEREKENVFFVSYEELMEEPKKHVKRLAEFLGCSLNGEEIEQVVWECSHERLSKLAADRDGAKAHWSGMKFSSFFRRGVVGDWKSHLTPEMMGRLHSVADQRWEGSGSGFGVQTTNGSRNLKLSQWTNLKLCHM